MARVHIVSGGIRPNVLYENIGTATITYNAIPYTTGQFFFGIQGVSTYSAGAGTQIVYSAIYFQVSS